MGEEWKIYIYSISGAGKILRKEWEDGSVLLRLLSSGADDSDPYLAWLEKDENEWIQEKHGKLIKREWIEFPDSAHVRLVKGGPRCGTDNKQVVESMPVLIRCDRFLPLCDSLKAYRKGTTISSREETYRNLYQVYEQLSKDPNQELKAIRHSLSHPRKALTSKKTIETLHSLFGDTKINFQIYKHAKVFREKYKKLKSETESLLVEEILKILPSSPNFLGKYYMP